ncbi:MAG TPA: hypothetical protein VH592_08515 [Gemmataceae bacterium]|jgi:hypothetical protein
MRSRLSRFGIAASFLLACWSHFITAGQKDAQNAPPKEVRDLVGTYTGEWTMFGIDEKGATVKRMAWTDTMKAEKPEVKDGRAYVSTLEQMTFEGGKTPPFKIEGKEGYYLKKDGGLGDYFIETVGKTHRMVKLGDNVWSYTIPAPTDELVLLGFPKEASGVHVLIKVVTKEQGNETHRISRLTTVSWKDKMGKERGLQFVSLQGIHKRQP